MKNIEQFKVDNIIEAIKNKRAGHSLSYETIYNIVQCYVDGNIPDYQMASWVATMASIGMTFQETKYLTESYVNSGANTGVKIKNNGKFIVDKHSTGGVGDKVTLIVVPIVVACGCSVVKLSGRSLGHAGGTIDKLESINGLKLDLSCEELQYVFDKTGMVIASQSSDLVPGDKAVYNLRDLIGYENSISFIAASIISKKVVIAPHGLVLDVKTGHGALIEDYAESRHLAETMLKLAYEFKINCRIVLSDMSNPLGYAIGNFLEIQEVRDVLCGKNVPYLTELCFVIARLMLQISDPSISDETANSAIQKAIDSGDAFNKFLQWIRTQGGEIDQLINSVNFKNTKYKDVVLSQSTGWIKSINAKTIGMLSAELSKKIVNNDIVIDHFAGILLLKHVSDRVEIGDSIAEIYYNNDRENTVSDKVLQAFDISDSPNIRTTIIHEIF